MNYSKMNLHGGMMNRIRRQSDKLNNGQLSKIEMPTLDIKSQKSNTSLKPVSFKLRVNRTRY
jgi:hypothetical protein